MVTTASETESKPKILVEFCLTPDNKRTLQEFLDHNYLMMRLAYPMVREKFHRVIYDTFPPGALEEIAAVLHNQSELAVLVKNCPERKGLGDKPDVSPEHTYSNFLGRALYEMFNVEHIQSVKHTRRSHKNPGQKIIGDELHRDIFSPKRNMFSREKQRSRYIILSCPHNEEHAVTEVANIRQALETIPAEERGNTFIDVAMYGKDDVKRINLETLYRYLIRPISGKKEVRVKKIYSADWHEETMQWETAAPRLMQALEKTSVAVDLQPGDLLVFGQQCLFHRAHPGDQERIDLIPRGRLHSRMILHNAGAPVTQR